MSLTDFTGSVFLRPKTKDIRDLNPRRPWIFGRNIDLTDLVEETEQVEGRKRGPDDELVHAMSGWLKHAGQYVESLVADRYIHTEDLTSMFFEFQQCPSLPRLKDLDLQHPVGWVNFQKHGPTMGDLLMRALRGAPLLEKLSMEHYSFSSMEAIEQFFQGAQALTSLKLNKVLAASPSGKSIKRGEDHVFYEAIGHAFCRGIQYRSKTLTSISIEIVEDWTNEEDNGGPNNSEELAQSIMPGIFSMERVDELELIMDFDISDATITAIRFLLSGLRLPIGKLAVTGYLALIGLFQGLSARTTDTGTGTIDELRIRIHTDEESSNDDDLYPQRLAQAIRLWNNSQNTPIIKKFVQTDGASFGERCPAADAFADSITCRIRNMTLEHLSFGGSAVPPWPWLEPIIESMRLLQVVELHGANVVEWARLNEINDYQGSRLKAFRLDATKLSQWDVRDLVKFFSKIKCFQTLDIKDGQLTSAGHASLANLIKNTELKELSVVDKTIGTQGAKEILQAALASKLERLKLRCNGVVGAGDGDDLIVGAGHGHNNFSINDFPNMLGIQLCHSRLVDLNLSSSIALEGQTVNSLAAGLCDNPTLKKLALPYIAPKDLGLLGESLVTTVLERLESDYSTGLELENDPRVSDGGRIPKLVEANPIEEKSMLTFITLLPNMKSLKTICGLFDRIPTTRLTDCVVAALKVNTILDDVRFDGVSSECPRYVTKGHLFRQKNVEFYLDLNLFQRGQYLAAIGDKTIPGSLLPLILAKMTRPGLESHLFYFLQHGASLLQSSVDASSSSLKRKTASPSPY